MQEVEKRKRTIINVIYFAIIVVIGFLAVRYALSVCLPFAIAFVFAAILQKPKKFLVKKAHFKNGAAAGLCVFLALLIVAALISLVGVRIFDEIKGFISYIGAQLKNLDEVVNNIETWLMNLISSLPEFLSKTLKESASDLFSSIREYLAGESNNLSSSITSSIGEKFEFSWITGPLSGVISTAKQLPTVFLSVLIVLTSPFYVQIYRVDESVRHMTMQILLAYALVAPFKVENMILGSGVIRSGGRTEFVMVIDLIGTWLFGVPLGLLSAFLFKLSIPWVYFILSLEECVRFGLSLAVFKRKRWMRSLKA